MSGEWKLVPTGWRIACGVVAGRSMNATMASGEAGEERRGGRTPVQLGARRLLVREGAYRITYPYRGLMYTCRMPLCSTCQ